MTRILLFGLYVCVLLTSCATQTYQAKPIDPAQAAADFRARSLDSPELREYMLAQGYPRQALPIKAWGLQELTLAAFFYHPRIEIARGRLQAAQAAMVTAGQRPNPGIAGNAEHHNRTDGGVSPWTLGFNLDIPVETSNKRQIRTERADRLAEAARIEIGQIAWEIRSQLRASIVEYDAANQLIARLQREAETHEEIVAMLENRLSAGMVSDIDLTNARLHLQKTRRALALETGRLPELSATIAAATGLPAEALEAVTLNTDAASPPAAGALPAAEIQRAALLNRLDISAARMRYDAAEAALKLEIAKQYPDMVLSPGYIYDQGDNIWALGLSLALAILNKNEGPIAEARAQRDVAAAQFMELQARVIGEQQQALAHYQAMTQSLASAEKLLTDQQDRYAMSERQFAAGYTDRLELAGNRLERLNAEQSVLEARSSLARAQGQLEDALQRPLDADVLPALPNR